MDAKSACRSRRWYRKAIELLRERYGEGSLRKLTVVAAEGLTGVFVNGNVAAVVEVNAETDFVAKKRSIRWSGKRNS